MFVLLIAVAAVLFSMGALAVLVALLVERRIDHGAQWWESHLAEYGPRP